METKRLVDVLGEKKLNDIIEQMGYLWSRWNDEKGHESFIDYQDNIAKYLPDTCEYIRLTNRPFCLFFKCDNKIARIKFGSKKVTWGFAISK
jgi:hypothetical protein